MRIAAIIVGIDGFEQYTLPLIQSIWQHEPLCTLAVIDNASRQPYPTYATADLLTVWRGNIAIGRTERLSYSAAINKGKSLFDNIEPKFDWYIVLSNDVLCTGPFAHLLEGRENSVVGPLMKNVLGYDYLEGWCVAIPKRIWEKVGGWDEKYLGSDWEDVDFSTSAREHGFWLIEDTNLPFKHLDQRQRYHIVEDFAGKNAHNQNYFMQKHARVTA